MGRRTAWPLLLTVLAALLSLSAAADTIAPGDVVRHNDSLISADGNFKLGFFTPGSSRFRYLGIWYNTIPVQTVVWVANRDRPLPDSTGVLYISGKGRLVLSDAGGTVYWSTDPATELANPVARLLNSCNFVVAGNSTGDYAWQSFNYPTDSLLPGMKLGWDLRTGRNRNITSWKSVDDPAPGECAMVMDLRGYPQVFLVWGRTRLWSAGPWNGQRFSGVPEMNADDAYKFSFHNDADGVYYWFEAVNSFALSRMVAQPTGVVEHLTLFGGSRTWTRFWFAPKDECDSVSLCGAFGVCDPNGSHLVCSCVRGFDPRSPTDWNLRDGRDGCVRRTALDCRTGTDGFVQVAGAKLPDTAEAVVNHTMGQEECRAACLRNCSCTAYASADITGGGAGCILWGGILKDLKMLADGRQDLFVRVAAADLATTSSNRAQRRYWVAAVPVVGAVVGTLLLGWIGWFVWRRKRRQMKTTVTGVLRATSTGKRRHRKEKSSAVNDDLELPLFDFSTIAAATDDFSAENKLGEGGFGSVYMVKVPWTSVGVCVCGRKKYYSIDLLHYISSLLMRRL